MSIPMRVLRIVVLAALAASGAISSAVAQDSLADEGLKSIRAIEAAFRRAINQAKPSVVSIYVYERSGQPTNFRPEFSQRYFRTDVVPDAVGSGIIVDAKGLILTCYHVVIQGQSEEAALSYDIKVQLADGSRHDARILAADPRSDLAMLSIAPDRSTILKPIQIADGAALLPGQFVLAIGNPFGTAEPDGATSASWGIVSNIRRRIVPEPERPRFEESNRQKLDQLHIYQTLIQTDARLNTGISGGALIDVEGKLVGITAALTAAVGYETPGGFAIPTDELTRRIIARLSQGREVEYGFLGIGPVTVTASEASSQGNLPLPGAKVSSIFDFLPAYRVGGLRIGDVITRVDGKSITNKEELVIAVGSKEVGTSLALDVMRNGNLIQLNVPLAKYPIRNALVIASNKRPLWNGIRVDHLSTLLSPENRMDYPEGGVAVREVVEGSEAQKQGVKPRDVITKINGIRVQSPDEFDRESAKASLPARITIYNGGDVVFGAAAIPRAKTVN